MRKYFEQFGEVTQCTIMRDPQTNRSRGFGFLTFRDASAVNVVMVKEHHLDGKIVSLDLLPATHDYLPFIRYQSHPGTTASERCSSACTNVLILISPLVADRPEARYPTSRRGNSPSGQDLCSTCTSDDGRLQVPRVLLPVRKYFREQPDDGPRDGTSPRLRLRHVR